MGITGYFNNKARLFIKNCSTFADFLKAAGIRRPSQASGLPFGFTKNLSPKAPLKHTILLCC